jgi:hypothetical protein
MLTETKPQRLSMDTNGMREGLHVWVKGTPYSMGGDPADTAISIHLTRNEAFWLMREIMKRLF